MGRLNVSGKVWLVCSRVWVLDKRRYCEAGVSWLRKLALVGFTTSVRRFGGELLGQVSSCGVYSLVQSCGFRNGRSLDRAILCT